MNHIKSFLILIFLCGITVSDAQFASQNLWNEASYPNRSNVERRIIPSKFKTFKLDLNQLKIIIKNAPLRFSNTRKSKPIISIPDSDGKISIYEVLEAPVLHPRLSKKYPEIRSYLGICLDNPDKIIWFDVTVHGFHGMILESGKNAVFIDPYAQNEKSYYIFYTKKNLPNQVPFECKVETKEQIFNNPTITYRAGDCDLRTYDLALACTGEYAQYHGGTKSSALSAMNTTMTRVNGIYERDLAIRMIIIANNDDIIYLDASTDPYTNNNSNLLVNENQQTCDNVIGPYNYDIGHVFSTGGGGLAWLRGPCGSTRAKAVTGSLTPTGDPFDIDYVCHEMGHQFGADHTFNNLCSSNRSNNNAIEPGSGSTIMGYAGICPPNIQNNSDAYFHGRSIEQIQSFISGSGSFCATKTTTGNNPPVISTINNYTIPNSTPFELTANATDGDGDIITYCWEQMDKEITDMPPVNSATEGPSFRSLEPIVSPTRSFPKLSSILTNTPTTWESLPTVARTLNFRCTIRDNHMGAGCTDEYNMIVTVSNNSIPFEVTAPNTNVTWYGAEYKEINWNVANTNISPINTPTVDIYLSTDGGNTFPIVLVTNETNDGNTTVLIPENISSSTCRIKIKGSNNIFFDISDTNFTIDLPQVASFSLSTSLDNQSVCNTTAQTANYQIDFSVLNGFNEPITLTLDGLPSGVNYIFSPNPKTPPGSVALTIDQFNQITPGEYPLTVNAHSSSMDKTLSLTLTVLANQLSSVNLILPTNGIGNLTLPVLNWYSISFASEYLIELSTNPSFPIDNKISYTSETTSLSVPNLSPSTAYYWRVRAVNACTTSDFSPVWSFQTADIQCSNYSSTDTPKTIPNASTTNSIINIAETKTIYDLNVSVNITHSWIGDLIGTIKGPDNTSVLLLDRPGIPESEFGCGQDNLNIVFNDQAIQSASTLESTCNSSGSYAIEGEFRAIGSLADYNNLASQGNWTLQIQDLVENDGGTINSWSIEVCYFTPITSNLLLLKNETLAIEPNQTRIISNELKVSSSGVTSNNLTYTLFEKPNFGDLKLNSTILSTGSQFTQDDIDSGKISYTNTSTSTNDFFVVNINDNIGGWISNVTFNINIIENNLSASTNIVNTIDCNSDANGSISINATGGTPPYTYSIDENNFQSSNIFTNLSANTYNFTVKDGNNFTITTSIILTEPSSLVINTNLSGNTLTISASGGISPYSYSVDGQSYQSQNNFTLNNGQYTVYVKDANNCISTESLLVSINSIILSYTTTPILCFNDSNGQIIIAATGGAEPYQYSINNGVNFQASNIFTNMSAGTYKIVVKDNDGYLKQTENIILQNPEEITANISINGSSITITSPGSNTFSIDNGIYQSSNTFTNISNGNHIAHVKNTSGCEKEFNFTININSLELTYSKIDPLCFDDATGQITAIATGGNGTLTYSINNNPPQSSNVCNTLNAGSYVLKVTDTSGTSKEISIQLMQPTEITIETTITGKDVKISAKGGTSPYLYQIVDFNDFQVNTLIQNVTEGVHIVRVKDSNNCIKEKLIEITSVLKANILSKNITCNGGSDGQISITATGGKIPYQYSINNSSFGNSNIFNNLSADIYHIVIKDANNIEFSSNLELTEPEKIDLMITSEYDKLVVDNSNAQFISFSINGTDWQSDNEFPNLNNGQYLVYAKDSNDCITTKEYNLQFTLLAGTVTINITCGNIGTVEIIAIGGRPPYQYSLDNDNFQSSNIFTDTNSGTVNFYIKDALGHSFHGQTILVGIETLYLSANVTGGTVELNATGGTPPYEYSIDSVTFQSNNIFNQLSPNSYTAIVKDQKGCTATYDVIISGIEETDRINDLTIFPNPTTGQFVLRFNESTKNPITISIYNLIGQKVYEKNYKKQSSKFETTINLKNDSGIYQLIITDGEKMGIKRIIIVK